MKKIILAVAVIFLNQSIFAQHTLEMLWQTDTVLKAPESVRPDPNGQVLYVSNIGDFSKEGTGSISKIDRDGKIIQNHWVTGLTAPKGLGVHNNLLYTAEHTTVAVIDIATGAIKQRIPIEGAQMLNDITIDEKGAIYVSDSRTGKVHKIENGKIATYLENINGVNGLLASGNDLYVLAGSSMQKVDGNKTAKQITDGIEGGADGIEKVADNDFIVSGWGGTVYYVKSDGTKQALLDTREQKINAADLWYDKATGIVYIPAMSKNKVVAYKLK